MIQLNVTEFILKLFKLIVITFAPKKLLLKLFRFSIHLKAKKLFKK